MFYQSLKHRKSAFHCFLPLYLYIIEQMNKPRNAVCRVSINYTVIKHLGHARTIKSPAASVFFIFLVFSNACRVLSHDYSRKHTYVKPVTLRPSSENRSLLGMKAIWWLCIRITGLTCRTVFLYETCF